MTPQRAMPKQKRIHLTLHRRAISDPSAQKMINRLRRDWATLNPIERGDRLHELAALGCSTRGLGEEVGQSAITVRRHMELAGLPSEIRKAVETCCRQRVDFLDGALNEAAPYVAIGLVEEEVEVTYSGATWHCTGHQAPRDEGHPETHRLRVEELPSGSFGTTTLRPYDRKTDPPLDYQDFMAKVRFYYDAHPADGGDPLLVTPSNRPATTLVAQAPAVGNGSAPTKQSAAATERPPEESPENLKANARLVELERRLTEKWDLVKPLLPPQTKPNDRQEGANQAPHHLPERAHSSATAASRFVAESRYCSAPACVQRSTLRQSLHTSGGY